jgi:hypothetical protein
VALAGCGSSKPKALAWRDVTPQLGRAQLTRPAGATFEKQSDLDAYLRQAVPGRVPPALGIDWSRDEVVLIASGARSSTGYALRVRSIKDHGDRVVVDVREEAPTLDEPVTARLTYPHRLIALRRPGKRVVVHFEGRP